jgi:hypothetical protein
MDDKKITIIDFDQDDDHGGRNEHTPPSLGQDSGIQQKYEENLETFSTRSSPYVHSGQINGHMIKRKRSISNHRLGFKSTDDTSQLARKMSSTPHLPLNGHQLHERLSTEFLKFLEQKPDYQNFVKTLNANDSENDLESLNSNDSIHHSGSRVFEFIPDILKAGKISRVFLRCLLMLPGPFICVLTLWLNPETRTTRPVSIAKTGIITYSCVCFVISKMIFRSPPPDEDEKDRKDSSHPCRRYISWWSPLEIFEGLLAWSTCSCSIILTSLDSRTGAWTPRTYSNILGFCFLFGTVCAYIHTLIDQVKQTQREKNLSFIQDTVTHLLFLSMWVAYCVLYAMKVTGNGRLKGDPASWNLVPLALSNEMSCASQNTFESIFKNSTFEDTGCPFLADGSPATPWCGYVTWQDACREISIVPVSAAIQSASTIVTIQPVFFVAFYLLNFGRGTIRRNQTDKTDKHIESQCTNMLAPRNLFQYVCVGINICVLIYVSGDMFIFGAYITGEMATTLPAKFALPGYCFGECYDMIYNSWAAMWFVVLIHATFFQIAETFCNHKINIDFHFNWKQRKLDDADLLDPQQLKTLRQQMDKPRNKDTEDYDKFNSPYISGDINQADESLENILGVSSEEKLKMTQNWEEAIVKEFNDYDDVEQNKGLTKEERLTKKELQAELKYIWEDKASKMECDNGVRDVTHEGWTLDRFMKEDEARHLERHHVLALRLYTTKCYKVINAKLRKRDGRHPLAATVFCIDEGIKFLRKEARPKFEKARRRGEKEIILWRGIDKVVTSDEFLKHGGLEYAPMSTTSRFEVALRYAKVKQKGECSIFKINVKNFNYGAELEWLSAFEAEHEVLFPPRTALIPTGKKQDIRENGCEIRILEMEVQQVK